MRYEVELEDLVRAHRVDEVVFAHSDVSYPYVTHRASRALVAGADFRLLGPRRTSLVSSRPVVAVCAVRTRVGKSQTTRRVAVIRHPRPYGDLERQAVQRFASVEDLDRHRCTI